MKINDVLISLLTSIFGHYWYIYVGYMILNILDWITGIIKSIKLKQVSSSVGIKGLLNKIGYWIVIGIAFSFSGIFVVIGKEIMNIDLSFMYLLGWFTFAALIINEAISILENLVLLNVKVPTVLIKSLKVTESLIDKTNDKMLTEYSDNNQSQ